MKKKKNKKKLLILTGIAIVVIVILGIFLYKQMAPVTDASTQALTVVTGENQSILDITIQSMIGNEMTGVLHDASSEEVSVWIIPVGTEVITKLGTTTTFARLAGGNHIQMLVDDATQEILKIWIQQ